MITFSFIIPVKPGGTVTALTSLRNVTDSEHPFEVLIVEGCAPSLQRNAAVAEAHGDVVFFLDDDSHVLPDCLEICAAAMKNPDVAVTGGPSLTPVSDSLLQQLFGSALSSVFGAGAVRNRYRAVGGERETTDSELILCNLAFKREVFLAVGGFDERLYPNEENELLGRIVASGFKLLHVPKMSVQRSQRKSLYQFIRQMFSYGRGRAQQTLISSSCSVFSFVPMFFVIYLATLFFVPFTFVTLLPLIVYCALNLIFSQSAVCKSGALSRTLLLFLFPVLHIANGCGLLWGFAGGVRPVSKESPDAIAVKRIKTFEQVMW